MNDTTKQVTGVWKEFGSLINTCLLLVGMATLFVKYGQEQEALRQSIIVAQADIERAKNDASSQWIEHMTFHRERASEIALERGRIDERFKALEKMTVTIENLMFRTTSIEANLRENINSRSQTEEKINRLVTDVAIIKDQLVGRTPTPTPRGG